MNIVILLSTYNAEKYLPRLLESLQGQTHRVFRLLIRDDGSSDTTMEMLRKYLKDTTMDIEIVPSEANLGAKESFGALLEYSIWQNGVEYFMFCDQDDVWLPNKIEQTLATMKKLEHAYPGQPVLVHTDLKVVDEHLKVICESFWEYEHIDPAANTLNRLLMQNTVTGCTTMINRALAVKALPIPSKAIMHDWWIGLCATAFGRIGYCSAATVWYRQHLQNDTGARKYGPGYMAAKAWETIRWHSYGTHIGRNIEQARAFLESYGPELDNSQRRMLEAFVTITEQSWLHKRAILIRYDLFKSGWFRNMGLMVGI